MTRSSSSIRKRAYYRVFGGDASLSRVLRPGWRVLDVGCSDGRGSVRLTGSAGCDIYRPNLEEACRTARRRPVVQADICRLPYRDGAFHAVVALDVVEHFEKADALRVISEMERVSRSVVVVMTPAGFVPQPGTAEEPWQEHRCGFEPAELEAFGFEVTGVGGLAVLRGDYGSFRWGPAGKLLAAATQPLTRSVPSLAFHLVGVKHVDS